MVKKEKSIINYDDKTMINISKETLKKLVNIKYSLNLKNYNEVLNHLIKNTKKENGNNI